MLVLNYKNRSTRLPVLYTRAMAPVVMRDVFEMWMEYESRKKSSPLLQNGQKIAPKIYKKRKGATSRKPKPYYPGDPKKFQVILMDPPWHYRNDSSEGTCHRHYKTMTDDELCRFDIDKYADPKQCALLMWATAPKLDSAFRVIKAWRFTYKTIFFTWLKTNKQGIVS